MEKFQDIKKIFLCVQRYGKFQETMRNLKKCQKLDGKILGCKKIFLERYTTVWKILGNYEKFQEMFKKIK